MQMHRSEQFDIVQIKKFVVLISRYLFKFVQFYLIPHDTFLLSIETEPHKRKSFSLNFIEIEFEMEIKKECSWRVI